MNNKLISLIALGKASSSIQPDSDGKIPTEYLPSYVDDVEDLLAVTDTAPSTCAKGDKYYNTVSKKIFTATSANTWGSTGKNPEKGKIYINTAEDPATSWRWSGTELIMIGGGNKDAIISLGCTSQYNTSTNKLNITDYNPGIYSLLVDELKQIHINIERNGITLPVVSFFTDDIGGNISYIKYIKNPKDVAINEVFLEIYHFYSMAIGTAFGCKESYYYINNYAGIQKSSEVITNSNGIQGLTTGAQTISGVKTFNSLPESSVAPTTNNQLVNKKYVDDNTGGNKVYHVIQQHGTWKLGANSKAEIIATLNEYLQTGAVPKATVSLSSAFGVPTLYSITNSASGNDGVQVVFNFYGLYLWHSAQTDWGVQSKDLRSGGSFTVYVSKAEWDAKNITQVYYGSYQNSSSSTDFSSSYVGARVMVGSPIGAEYTVQKISNGSVPTPGSSHVSHIYWWGSPRVYDTPRDMWYEPNHFYHCEQENVSSGNYRMYDFLYRQAIESVYTELGLKEYDTYGIYAVGDYVYFKGKIYKCLTAKPDQTASQFVPLNWSEVTLINYLREVLISTALGGNY